MSKDLHKSSFDEATKAKLDIFRLYLREWLPVFIAKKEIFWNRINIFDFFAGPGQDINGEKGTPLIILEELLPYHQEILDKKLIVRLFFNEYDVKKLSALKRIIESQKNPFEISTSSLDFKDAFGSLYPTMKIENSVNLLFLDQYGIKHINEDIFKAIININRTDFLFFISSSTIKRFAEHPAISKYIDIDPTLVDSTPYHLIHQRVLEFYKSLIPLDKEYYLGPFSLKKKSGGLYGLIFGSQHILGIEKFLKACWRKDPQRGIANFDIDSDNIIPGQLEIFSGNVKRPKKVELFEQEVEEKILSEELRTDKDLYLFTLTRGFLPKHSRNVVKKLQDQNKIHKVTLELSSKVWKQNAKITSIIVNK